MNTALTIVACLVCLGNLAMLFSRPANSSGVDSSDNDLPRLNLDADEDADNDLPFGPVPRPLD